MSIIYCDFTTGDDVTGDGSAADPYKTITKASTGLSGGDEVRVAKSPADTALTGTLGFTINSTAVTGVDTLFSSELAIGDFVKGGDEQWYEVITITDNTHATLYQVYPSTTESGVSSQKLGITSTGEAASSTTQVQVVSASGSSAVSRLKISGGWDLTGPTQDGQTYFRQMHGTFGNRYGYGLYSSGKSYVEIELCHFLRYKSGVKLYNSSNNVLTSLTCSSNSTYGIHLDDSSNCTITSPVCNSNDDTGIDLEGSSYCTITDPICNGNDYDGLHSYNSEGGHTISNPTCNNNYRYGLWIVYSEGYSVISTPTCNSNGSIGMYLSNGSSNVQVSNPTCNDNDWCGIYFFGNINNIITNPTCNNNSSYGIYLDESSNNTIINPTCNDNDYGFKLENSANNIINKYSSTGNTSGDVYVVQEEHCGDFPCAKCQHFKAVGVNKCFYEYGITERDTADARSTQCLKYDPSSATYYISQSFFFKADSGVAQTLSAYIKDDASFNGDIQAAIYFMGVKITGWTEWTPTTSYVQKTIVAASGDITENGVLELRIKVRGAAGNVFVDDLSIS